MQLEEPATRGYNRLTILVIFLLLISCLVWAYVTPVPEISRARGEVVPTGLPHRIQFQNGGRIQVMHVKTGDFVDVGDRLVSLDPVTTQARLDQILARRVTLTLELERLSALLEQREPSFQIGSEHEQLRQQQRLVYELQKQSYTDQKRSLITDISQRETEYRRYQVQIDALLPRYDALQKKMSMFDRLRVTDAIPEVSRIDTRAEFAQVEAELAGAKGVASVARSAIESSRARLLELDSQIRQGWSLRASEVSAQLTELEQEMTEMQQHLQDREIYAPIKGVVKIMEIAGVNAVVGAGEVVMEIVPTQDRKIINALLPTRDIGHVTVGQTARVQLDGFENNQSDWLEGNVTHLSASSYLDGEGVPHYYTRVQLDEKQLALHTNRIPIIPGMTANVQIMTGEKTVMEYLLKPITRGFNSALGEK